MKQACLAVGQADIVQTSIRTYRGYTFQVEIFCIYTVFRKMDSSSSEGPPKFESKENFKGEEKEKELVELQKRPQKRKSA